MRVHACILRQSAWLKLKNKVSAFLFIIIKYISKKRVSCCSRPFYFCVMTDYQRIEKAISYISENFRQQPDLNEVAQQVYLSPFHFQRLFREWAGVTPKKFLQYISLEHAKQ